MSDDEAIKEELVDRLNQLGLSSYEAHTLVDLVQLGTGTASDIANVDGVPRTRVYGAIDTLHELGFVDIQYTTPRKYTVVSRGTLVRKLDRRREDIIREVAELLAELGPAVQPPTEQLGVWTVRTRNSVAERVVELIDEAEHEVIYMTVDELLTDDELDALSRAEERGADIHLAGISGEVQARIRNITPSAELFETLWEWSDEPAGRLLVVDQRSALVSVQPAVSGSGATEEAAIWGSGEHNTLVVVLRAIFTWRLGADDALSAAATTTETGIEEEPED